MEIRAIHGRLSATTIFQMIAVGYLLGAGAIFLPIFILFAVSIFAINPPVLTDGEMVRGPMRLVAVAMVFAVPFILAMQSVIFGGLGVLGLTIYQRFRPIRVVAE